MSKLLITGGGSKFTNSIIEKVKNKYNKVYLITKKSNPNYKDKKIKHIKFDLLSSEKIPVKADIILHMAAIVPYRNNSSAIKNILEKNLKLTDNVLKYAVNNKIKKIIFISSTDVYPLFNKKKINIKTKLSCHNEYGLSKIACEKLLKTYCDIFQITLTILRLGPIYSEKISYNKISSLLLNLKENINITINNPDDILSLLNIECACKAIASSINSKPGTYLITGPSLTKKKFFFRARKKYQSNSMIVFIKKKLKKIRLEFDISDQMKKFTWKFDQKKMFNNF